MSDAVRSLTSATHRRHSAVSLERVIVSESCFLGIAEGGGDGVASHTRNLGLRVCDGLAVLNIEAFDLCEGTSYKLSYDGELACSVHGLSIPVECSVCFRS